LCASAAKIVDKILQKNSIIIKNLVPAMLEESITTPKYLLKVRIWLAKEKSDKMLVASLKFLSVFRTSE
jgi:hypothetical protein